MTALDTNVVVRYLVDDNAEQAEAARALLDELTPGNPGFICREVIVEVAWVLERSYRFTRTRVAEVLMHLNGFGQSHRREFGRCRRCCTPLSAGRRRVFGLDDPYSGRTGGGVAPLHL